MSEFEVAKAELKAANHQLAELYKGDRPDLSLEEHDPKYAPKRNLHFEAQQVLRAGREVESGSLTSKPPTFGHADVDEILEILAHDIQLVAYRSLAHKVNDVASAIKRVVNASRA